MFALSLLSSLQEAAAEVSEAARPNANPVAGSFLYFVGAMALFIFACAWISSSSDK